VINTTLASPSLFGNIRPVGATNLGATLGLNVSVPSTAVIPVGAPFNIVQTQTGTLQSGTNGSILSITSTNPLYAFSQVPPTGGTPAGLVSIVTTRIPLLVPIVVPPVVTPPVTPPVVITPPGVSPIVVPPIVVPPITTPVVVPPTQPIAAPVVMPIITLLPTLAPTSTLTPVVAAINSLTNPADVINAVAQLAPSAPDLAAPLVTFQGAREFQNLWLSRMDEVMCGQISQPVDPAIPPDQTNSTCRENELRSGLWAKGFGYFGSQDAQNAFLGYDARIYGTMIGYDVPVNPETRVGLGFGYARNIIDGKTLSANTDSNTYQGTAYLTHEHGPWFIQGDASFGWDDYSGSRNISLPGISLTPKANYSGLNYTTFMTTGYHFFNQGFTITPLASLQYTHVDLDRYTETGAGDVDLNVNSQSYDFVESGLGVKVARPFAYNDGTYVPEMHFKWFRELVNPTFENTAAFTAAGSPFFTTPGMKAGDNTFDLGVGLQLLSCDCTAGNWSVEAVYDHEWRSRWSGSPPVSSGEIDKDGAIVTRRIQDGRCEPWIADGRGNDACAASELLCRRCVEAFPEAA